VAVTLGNITFDAAHTTVDEKYEEVGGRDERLVEVAGAIVGESTVAGIEARLDAILDAASEEDYGAVLSVRDGRRLNVRREAFSRDVAPDQLVGSFELKLRAKDAFEEADEETSELWPVTASGATRALSSAGNVFAKPVVSLVASGDVVSPSLSDGIRTMAYAGTVADGSVLVFDAAARTVTLDGEDVAPYTTGDFARIEPEGTTLTYTDDATSSHTTSVTVAFRDRWW
jgi:Siphovirus-type tail component, C-terminal domain